MIGLYTLINKLWILRNILNIGLYILYTLQLLTLKTAENPKLTHNQVYDFLIKLIQCQAFKNFYHLTKRKKGVGIILPMLIWGVLFFLQVVDIRLPLGFIIITCGLSHKIYLKLKHNELTIYDLYFKNYYQLNLRIILVDGVLIHNPAKDTPTFIKQLKGFISENPNHREKLEVLSDERYKYAEMTELTTGMSKIGTSPKAHFTILGKSFNSESSVATVFTRRPPKPLADNGQMVLIGNDVKFFAIPQIYTGSRPLTLESVDLISKLNYWHYDQGRYAYNLNSELILTGLHSRGGAVFEYSAKVDTYRPSKHFADYIEKRRSDLTENFNYDQLLRLNQLQKTTIDTSLNAIIELRPGHDIVVTKDSVVLNYKVVPSEFREFVHITGMDLVYPAWGSIWS